MAKKKRRPSSIPVPEYDDEMEVIHDNAELMKEVNGAKGVGAVVVHHLVTGLQLVMILILGAWGYLTYRDAAFFAQPNPDDRSSLTGFAVEGQVVRLEYALSVYYALNEKYPPSMTTLVDDGILIHSDLTYPDGKDRYKYQRFGDGYKLIVDRLEETEAETDVDTIIFEE